MAFSLANDRLLVCLIVAVIGIQLSYAQHWSYEHGNEWAAHFPICGSKTQSPIDFNPDTIRYNTTIPEFEFHNYGTLVNLTEFTLSNNGHSVQMNFKYNESSSGIPFAVSGGGLPNNFTLEQFHFHWGRLNEEGSEHTVQTESYPMELHLVHWDSAKFSSFGVAANSSQGLAVLGIFVQIAETNNPAFDALLRYFRDIAYQDGKTSQVSEFPLADLLPTNTRDFYRYSGSLTTPPCYNSVIWTVFVHPITISESQLHEFRTRLYEETINESKKTLLVDNFRTTQPIHGRLVYKTFEKVDWTYDGMENGPDSWKNFFPRCNGERQSPIDIPTASVVTDSSIQPLTFTSYASVPAGTTFTLANTGTSVDLLVGGKRALRVSGGGLGGSYVLERVSLHWGQHNGQGSEHLVNNLAYPLEMQFVHYSSSYSSFSAASSHPGGLAVITVLFQANPEDNSYLNPILNKLQNIRSSGNTLAVSAFSLMNLLPTTDKSFYRYEGSLTIPNCAETVSWIVYRDPQRVSAKQMDLIRTAVSSTADGLTPLHNNFRPPQPLSGRTVKLAQTTPSKGTTSAAPRSTSTVGRPIWLLFAISVSLITYSFRGA